jgi:hypothetical protein
MPNTLIRLASAMVRAPSDEFIRGQIAQCQAIIEFCERGRRENPDGGSYRWVIASLERQIKAHRRTLDDKAMFMALVA